MSVLDSFRLDGRVALITGASRGIGAGIAQGFAEAGADVALVARSKTDLEGVAESARGQGRRAVAIAADVGDMGLLPVIVQQALDSLGRIDILVNVAGVNRRTSILEMLPEDYNAVMQVNLQSVYFLSQAVGRVMIERGAGGKIINIASMTSFRGYADISPYSLSKTAIVALTRNLAVEWARYNIQANAIAPGWIETAMTATIQPSRRQWIIDHTPQGRFGTPREVAQLAIYLASPASDFMTGQVLPLDGGFLSGHPWPELAT